MKVMTIVILDIKRGTNSMQYGIECNCSIPSLATLAIKFIIDTDINSLRTTIKETLYSETKRMHESKKQYQYNLENHLILSKNHEEEIKGIKTNKEDW